jgi:soluble lytic murein transglycosylase-like protein
MVPDEPVVSDAPQTEVLDPFVDLPPHKQKIAALVATLAPAYAVAPRLALAVITVESNFDPDARSQKDARGLLQRIPDTATRFHVKNIYRGVPPYPETRSYVQRVLALFGDERHAYDPGLVAPAPLVTTG